METLLLLCEVAHEHQLAEVDFLLVAEMTLRIAMVLESSMDVPQSGRKTGTIYLRIGITGLGMA